MNGNDKILVSVDINNRGINLLNYFVDFKFNILGPEDFAVDGDTVYILSSIDNTVLEFKNDKFITKYNAGFVQGIKVAAYHGTVYILRNDFSIMRIGESHTEIMPVYNIFTEAVSDFMVIGEKIYIVISDGMGGYTYEFGFDVGGLDINMAKKYHGRIYDETTFYETQIMPYSDGTGGNGKVIVTDISNGSVKEISVHTNYFLSGIQYFGNDEEGGTYLKIYESRTDNSYNTILESRLSLIDSQNNMKYVRNLPEQYKNIINQQKSIGGQFYSMNIFKNGVEVIMMSKPDENSTREYTSKLDDIVPPSPFTENIYTDMTKTITRDQIMKNAMSYHSEFTWSCTEINLLPLQGWEKPRYVMGPGNYRFMPYCWGGNSTTDEFYMGLANGGRVGNINSPGPALLPNTFGHDCSGYVGLCWGETQKYSTNTIQSISYPIKKENLKQGDALDMPYYHILLFDSRDDWGNYILYECTVLNQLDRVAHTLRPIADLKNYIALRYKNVIDNEM